MSEKFPSWTEHPKQTSKKNIGDTNIPLRIGDTIFLDFKLV